MNIVMVHNLYRQPGGEDESFASESQVLRDDGHYVETLLRENGSTGSMNTVGVAMRSIWSNEDYRRMRKLLNSHPFDVVHVQNFFPLVSPAVHYAAYTKGVPTVQTLRNYRLLCPNGLFYRDGHPCEDCRGKAVPWPGVVHACYRESRSQSLAVAAMLSVHRALPTWTRMVDLYVAPTNFTRTKFVEAGFRSESIVVKPNCLSHDPGVGEHGGQYALFVGRLSVEKGVGILLDAWKVMGGTRRLKIVGDGPLRSLVERAADQTPNIEYLGFRSPDSVHDLMADATMLIVPSAWYETFGRVVMEAFAAATPVVASNMGAVSELIDDERSGLLFVAGDADDLVEKVEWAWTHPSALAAMGWAGRRDYEANYTAERNRAMLMDIYAEARRRH
jgi:glycosyltransferase involved in cell wall biosynthesis